MWCTKINAEMAFPSKFSILPVYRCGMNDSTEMGAVPHVVLLVVPVLGRMSYQCEDFRIMATYFFATLIRLLPLEGSLG